MATKESTATDQHHEAGTQPTVYAFQPVDYGRPEVEHATLPGGAVQRFADTVEAVSIGAASILQLIEWDELRRDDHEIDPDANPAPVLNNFHRSALLRMVAVNMNLIADQSNSLKNWAYKHHTDAGKAEELAAAMLLVKRYQRTADGAKL